MQEIPSRYGSTIPMFPNPAGITVQTAITTSGTSQQSAAFASTTKYIDVISVGGAVYIAVGSDPTASSSTFYLTADKHYDFEVKAGDKIAVIDA